MILTGIEWGSCADWFGAIGTILAIMVSVWITRYQITNDRKIAKENFFDEQEFIMLNQVHEDIIMMHSAALSISRIVNNSDLDLSDEKNRVKTELATNFTKIREFIFQINNRLHEYGRTRQGYTDINMRGMRALLGSWNRVTSKINEIGKSPIKIDDINQPIEEFILDIDFMEEAIIQKKKDIRH